MLCQVLSQRDIAPDVRVLRITRQGLSFTPGQYIHLGLPELSLSREYSIYSGMDMDFLEILYSRIDQGALTPSLWDLSQGDDVDVQGPFGDFTLPAKAMKDCCLFISTGSGISPFHCLIHSFPDLNYRLLHGTRYLNYTYEQEKLGNRLVSCVSKGPGGMFSGRVTSWLEQNDLQPYKNFYLCGNSDMIYDCFSILDSKGIKRESICVETYF